MNTYKFFFQSSGASETGLQLHQRWYRSFPISLHDVEPENVVQDVQENDVLAASCGLPQIQL